MGDLKCEVPRKGQIKIRQYMPLYSILQCARKQRHIIQKVIHSKLVGTTEFQHSTTTKQDGDATQNTFEIIRIKYLLSLYKANIVHKKIEPHCIPEQLCREYKTTKQALQVYKKPRQKKPGNYKQTLTLAEDEKRPHWGGQGKRINGNGARSEWWKEERSRRGLKEADAPVKHQARLTGHYFLLPIRGEPSLSIYEFKTNITI